MKWCLPAGLLMALYPILVSADYLDYKKTRIIAVQNKVFTLRHEIQLTPTFLPFDPYTRGVGIGFSYSYHFTDTVAWTLVQGTIITGFETSLRSDLVKDYNADTTSFKEVRYILETSLRYTPFYYKGVFFNSLILHGHGYFTFGFSTLRVNEGVVEGSWKIGNNLGFGLNLLTAHDIVLSFGFKDHLYWDEGSVFQVIAMTFGFGINFGKIDTAAAPTS